MENAIRNAIIKFEQEFMGRGPDDVRAFIVRDLVVVRLKGVLTPAERQLAKTAEGVDMVKRLRQNLIALGRDKLCEQVSEITGAKTHRALYRHRRAARRTGFRVHGRSRHPEWKSIGGIRTMEKLVKGFLKFRTEVFGKKKALFTRLSENQAPRALFITCSDSRVDPTLLTQTDPGELFILRNAGNMVPPYGSMQGGSTATIEYAMAVAESSPHYCLRPYRLRGHEGGLAS